MTPRFHRSPAYGRFRQTARTEFSYSASAFPLVLVFRLLPYGLSVVSLPIRQPLPDNALQRSFGALYIINTEPNAIAVAEIELSKISVQVLFFAMLVDAFHAALEDRIEAFNRIGVDVAANVFLLTVVDGFVAGKLRTNLKILTSLVGHQGGFFRDVGANDRRNLGNGSAIHMEAAGGP